MIRNNFNIVKFKFFQLFLGLFLTGLFAAADRPPSIPRAELHFNRDTDFIGRGSFGQVFRGNWGGEEVAIKILDLHTITSAIQNDFEREVQAMWQSRYPRVVRLYGVCTEPGHSAMVLELMQGSLHELLQHHRDAPLPPKKLWQLGVDITQGLADLHNNHIIHRDLKSLNILLDGRGRAKIADFGLAKFRLASTTAGTQARSSAGTLRWRAPEWLNLRPPKPHPSMDMYSYGIVLWELLTRKIPFEEQPDDVIVKDAVKSGEREEIPEDCPEVWHGVIAACWQQDTTKRPTAQAILELLLNAQPERPQPPVWLYEDQTKVIPSCGYVLTAAGQADWEKVLGYYRHHAVPGYDVGRVDVIYHPSMNRAFAAKIELLQQRKGNPRYAPDWRHQGNAAWRGQLQQHLTTLAEPYVDDNTPNVNVLPLWHGTQRQRLGSLLSAGFTPFGTTDDGYFGRGIYLTHEAQYANMYANYSSNGSVVPDPILILNWVASYSSFPIMRGDFDENQRKLTIRIPSGKYDAHLIPVVSYDPSNPACMDYRPTAVGEAHRYTEVVVFDNGQVLPRYVVQLQAARSGMNQQSIMQAALREKVESEQRLADRMERLGLVPTSQAGGGGSSTIPTPPIPPVSSPARPSAAVAGGGGSASALPIPPASVVISRPVSTPLPAIARGNEEMYTRFMNGKLVYTDPKTKAKRDLPIAAMINPETLEGEFNLSGCGDTGQYLSINTGYRKGKKASNSNKVEVWLAPRFLVHQGVTGAGRHLQPVLNEEKWPSARAPLGIFWTRGGWNSTDEMNWYDYLTNRTPCEIASENLYENWKKSRCPVVEQRRHSFSCSVAEARRQAFMFML